jgi:hypothetical protein
MEIVFEFIFEKDEDSVNEGSKVIVKDLKD